MSDDNDKSTDQNQEITSCDNGSLVWSPTNTGKIRPKLNWTRLNYKGESHDNRRLLAHRAKDCRCDVCWREIEKLPPAEPLSVQYTARQQKLYDKEVRRIKRKAKKEIKEGKQACIRNFFKYWVLHVISVISHLDLWLRQKFDWGLTGMVLWLGSIMWDCTKTTTGSLR